METLDRVYKAFSNLDRDFAKSKKTRSEFIIDKFGGDLDMGSMIILDAIGQFNGEETPEDIEKLTFVKDIFAKIMTARDSLDSLKDFSFGAEDDFRNLMTLLAESEVDGTGIRCITQAELNKRDKGTVHFISSADGVVLSRFADSKVVHAYNENMLGFLQAVLPPSSLELGGYYVRKSSMRVEEVPESKLNKALLR